MSADSGGSCWQCGRELTASEYGRSGNCEGCAAQTRVCRNCEHYDTGAANDCRDPAAERVFDKEKANFCDFFKATRPAAQGAACGKDAGAAKSAFDALFKQPED